MIKADRGDSLTPLSAKRHRSAPSLTNLSVSFSLFNCCVLIIS